MVTTVVLLAVLWNLILVSGDCIVRQISGYHKSNEWNKVIQLYEENEFQPWMEYLVHKDRFTSQKIIHSYCKLKRFDKAKQFLQSLPVDTFWTHNGEIIIGTLMIEYLENKLFDEVIELFETLIANENYNMRWYCYAIQAYSELGQFNKIEELRTTLERIEFNFNDQQAQSLVSKAIFQYSKALKWNELIVWSNHFNYTTAEPKRRAQIIAKTVHAYLELKKEKELFVWLHNCSIDWANKQRLAEWVIFDFFHGSRLYFREKIQMYLNQPSEFKDIMNVKRELIAKCFTADQISEARKIYRMSNKTDQSELLPFMEQQFRQYVTNQFDESEEKDEKESPARKRYRKY